MIKEIHEHSDFFDIDYKDLIDNFDTDDTEEKEKLSLQLSLVNVAFLDNIRGDISRPRFIDRILTIFRREMLEDVKNRMSDDTQ